MPDFAYNAVDEQGTRHRRTEEAADIAELTQVLERRGLLVLEIGQVEPESGRAGFGRRRGVMEATRALASLLGAGLPLARALEITAGLVGGDVGSALVSTRLRVQRGETLHAALADQPRFFTPTYAGVVRAGERSGDLSAAFGRLEEQLEREDALQSRLLSASIYPLILAVVGGVAVVLLALFVLPRFAELLTDSGATLPTSTRVLLGLSNAAVSAWPVLAVGPPVAGLLGGAWLGTEAGRRAASRTLLGFPGIRSLRSEALAARFARLTGVMVAGGAPLLDALEDAAGSLGDPLARDETVRVRLRVREGASLNGALAAGSLYPPLLAQLVAVGEESGRLEEFLGKAADLFEARVTRSAERLAALAEPVMILVFGGLVGLVALSLLQAIYGVNAGAF